MNNVLRFPSRQLILPPPIDVELTPELIRLSLTKAKTLGVCPPPVNDTETPHGR